MVGRRTVIIGPCGSSGGGGLATNNCCGTIYQAGSVDLDGLEWATDYTITLAAPIGTVTVTDQGSGTWESDAIDVTCTVDEVTVTDEYTVTMTATGNAPGEVSVTVALTSGGGYGGAAGCCATTEGGFAWKYVNCCIVDPLAGWSMTRDPSGFSGRECEIGGCEICVTPSGGAGVANTLCVDSWYNPSVPSITSAATAPFADSYRVWEKDVNFFDRYMIIPTFGTLNLDDDCFVWGGGTDRSVVADACTLPLARAAFVARRDFVEHTLIAPAMRWLHTSFDTETTTCAYTETSGSCGVVATTTLHSQSRVILRNNGITFRPCSSGGSGSLGLLEYDLVFQFAMYLRDPGPGTFDFVALSQYAYESTFEVTSTTNPKAASVRPDERFTLTKLTESWVGSGNDNFSWTDGIVIESLEMVPIV